MNKMGIDETVKKISQKTKIPASKIKPVIYGWVNYIKDELSAGREVKIYGFGRFCIIRKKRFGGVVTPRIKDDQERPFVRFRFGPSVENKVKRGHR